MILFQQMMYYSIGPLLVLCKKQKVPQYKCDLPKNQFADIQKFPSQMCVTPIIEEGMLSPRRGGGVSVYEAAGHGGYMMNGGSFSPRSLSPLHQQQLMQQQLPPPSPTAHPDAGGPYNPQTIRQVISCSNKPTMFICKRCD